MKIRILGTVAVGSASALALVLRGVCRELVLVDRARERAKAVGQIFATTPHVRQCSTWFDGDFNDLEGAALIMITAGVNAKTGVAIPRVG